MTYLHVVSIFPALTETFVLREMREMRNLGWNLIIAQLKSARGKPVAGGFEDLRQYVVLGQRLSIEGIIGVLYCSFTRSKLTIRYLRLICSHFDSPICILKLLYILLISMMLAYKLRNSGICHVRGSHLHSEAVAAMFISGFLDTQYSVKAYTVKLYYPENLMAEVIREATFVVADTQQTQGFIKSLGGDARLIRSGIHLDDFPFRIHAPDSLQPIILAVGRLDYKKGFHVLLDACSVLRETGVIFRCVIIGDGEQRRNLLSMRAKLNLEPIVEFLGNVEFSEYQRWLLESTVMVVPSVVAQDGSTDGLPTVIIEAFARGIPVIATQAAAIPEIIRNGVNGFTVQPNSPRQLANKITELLADPKLRSTFAVSARLVVERELNLVENIKQLSRLTGVGELRSVHTQISQSLHSGTHEGL